MGYLPHAPIYFFYSQMFVFNGVPENASLSCRKKVNNPDKISGLLFPQGLFLKDNPELDFNPGAADKWIWPCSIMVLILNSSLVKFCW